MSCVKLDGEVGIIGRRCRPGDVDGCGRRARCFAGGELRRRQEQADYLDIGSSASAEIIAGTASTSSSGDEQVEERLRRRVRRRSPPCDRDHQRHHRRAARCLQRRRDPNPLVVPASTATMSTRVTAFWPRPTHRCMDEVGHDGRSRRDVAAAKAAEAASA